MLTDHVKARRAANRYLRKVRDWRSKALHTALRFRSTYPLWYVKEMIAELDRLEREKPKLSHTVGHYRSGNAKHNQVAFEHLPDHLEYNLIVRPGRGLILNGVVINRGYHSFERIRYLSRLVKANPVVLTRCSEPYH